MTNIYRLKKKSMRQNMVYTRRVVYIQIKLRKKPNISMTEL